MQNLEDRLPLFVEASDICAHPSKQTQLIFFFFCCCQRHRSSFFVRFLVRALYSLSLSLSLRLSGLCLFV